MGKINISNEGDLDTFVNLTADEVNKLKGEVTRLKNDLSGVIGMNKYAMTEGIHNTATRGFSPRWNDFWKALIARDHSKILDLGGKVYDPGREMMEGKGRYITKADLGSPLETSAITGSYLIPTEFHNEIIRAMGEQSTMLPLCRSIGMNSRQMNIPVKSTAPSLVWITGSDTADTTESNPTFAQKTLTAYQLVTWVGISESLLEDTMGLLSSYLGEEFTTDFSNEIDNMVLNGDGGTVSTGLLGDGSCNIVTMDQGNASFSDIEPDDLYSMISAITTQKYRRGASFVFHPLIMDYLRQCKDASGRYLWLEPSAGGVASIAGYPVHFCDAAPSASAPNTAFGVFGNFRYFAIGQRIPLSVTVHDQTEYRVTNCEILIRARARYAFVNMIPSAFSVLKTAGN